MAFLFSKNRNLYAIFDETIIIKDSSDQISVFKNVNVKSVALEDTSSPKTVEPDLEDAEDEEMCCTPEQEKEDPEKNEVKETANPVKALKSNTGIICCCVSSCGQRVAVTDQSKCLTVWQNEPDHPWHVLSTRSMMRKCIRLRFCHTRELVLAADRAGDVFSFSLSDPQEPGQLLLGHLSMLLDMVISKDDKFVITSDRDEKIRVSHLPNAYNIQSYCLGHSEFVSALCLSEVNTNWLISGSGDGTMRTWDYKSGNQLCIHHYMSDINSLLEQNNCEIKSEGAQLSPRERIPAVSLIECAPNNDLLAVLFDKTPCIGIYLLEVKDKLPSFKFIQLIISPCEPWDVELLPTSKEVVCLLTLSPAMEEILTVHQRKEGSLHSKFVMKKAEETMEYKQLYMELNQHWTTLKDCKKIDDFQHLYKQWFDNMESYLEKKKLRQTEKLRRNEKRFKNLGLKK